MKGERLFCLDALRGLDMLLLCVIAPMICEFAGSFGFESHPFLSQFEHHWDRFTIYDMIMPLFIFMSGAAVPFALRKRLDDDGLCVHGARGMHMTEVLRSACGAWRKVSVMGAVGAGLLALGLIAVTYGVPHLFGEGCMRFVNMTVSCVFITFALWMWTKARAGKN